MSSGSAPQSTVWSKQKLSELDALLVELQHAAKKLNAATRLEADQYINRIRASRDAFRDYVQHAEADALDAAASGAAKSRKAAEKARADIEREWVEAGLAFQAFVSAASADENFMRKAIESRARAERRALDLWLDQSGGGNTEAAENARADFQDAMDRLSDEAQRLEAIAGAISSAGTEAWEVFRRALRDAYATTGQKGPDAR